MANLHRNGQKTDSHRHNQLPIKKYNNVTQNSVSSNHGSNVLLCHNMRHIKKINHIKPQVKHGLMFNSEGSGRSDPLLTKAVYVRMNSRDLFSIIWGYLYLWPLQWEYHLQFHSVKKNDDISRACEHIFVIILSFN